MTDANEAQPVRLNLLLLDDEKDILYGIERLLKNEYRIITFSKGQDALDYLKENPVDLIMSDMRMPSMDGVEFLAKSREIQQEPIRLLLTGYSDMEATVKIINDGGVYTYIGKPWDDQELKMTLSKAAEHYTLRKEAKQLSTRLVTANKELAQFNKSLEEKVSQRTIALVASKEKLQLALKNQQNLFQDILDMMSSTIEYRTGVGAGHVKRIALQCRAVAIHSGFDDIVCKRIYLCALLYEIGKVGLTDEVLRKTKLNGESVDSELAAHPIIGAKIIGRVKRFASLTENILHQDENYDGTGVPDHLLGEAIPIGARIIRIVKDFDDLVTGKENKQYMSTVEARKWLTSRADIWYDKKVMQVFFSILSDRNNNDEEMEYSVGIESLKIGDTLIEDLVVNGNVMVKEGQQVNTSMIKNLSNYEVTHNLKLTLFVR